MKYRDIGPMTFPPSWRAGPADPTDSTEETPMETTTTTTPTAAFVDNPELCSVCGQPDNCGDCNHFGTEHYVGEDRTPSIETHVTPGGKLAVKATTPDGLTKTSYIVGGYRFYVISAHRREHRYNPTTGEYDRDPHVAITVQKRTKDTATARRISRDIGGVVFERRPALCDGPCDSCNMIGEPCWRAKDANRPEYVEVTL